MKVKPISPVFLPMTLILFGLASGCSGLQILDDQDRIHAYVIETKVTAEAAMKTAYRFFKAKGNPKDLVLEPSVGMENPPNYEFNAIENDLYQGGNPKENAMLSELQVSGRVLCDSVEKWEWTDLIAREKTYLNFNFKFEAKDRRVRIEYYGVKITNPEGKFNRRDFTSKDIMVKTLDQCMGYLHKNLLKYINARHSNW